LPQALNSLALAPSGSLYTAALVPGGTLIFTSAEGGPVFGNLVRLDPADPTTAYAIIGYTAYEATAGRPHLRPLPLRGPVADLAVDPVTPSTLYAAIDARRPVFKSTDGGASWAPASFGLPRGALSPNTIVAGTRTAGAFSLSRR